MEFGTHFSLGKYLEILMNEEMDIIVVSGKI